MPSTRECRFFTRESENIRAHPNIFTARITNPRTFLLKTTVQVVFLTQKALSGSIPDCLYKQKKTPFGVFLFGDPYGNRTHDSTLRGWRLSRLTNGPFLQPNYYINKNFICQYKFSKKLKIGEFPLFANLSFKIFILIYEILSIL